MSLSILAVIVLTLGWLLIFGELSLNQLLVGLLVSASYVVMSRAGRGKSVPLRQLPRRLFYLAVYFFLLVPYSIVRSNLDLAGRIIRPRVGVRPGIVRLQVDPVSEATAALIGHAITMGPGEMVVDYSADQGWVYVHVVDVTDLEKERVRLWLRYEHVIRGIFT